MLRLNIDFSVFAPKGSAGVVSGAIECLALPRVGEFVILSVPKNKVTPVQLPGFNGHLKVADVLHAAHDGSTLLALESVNLQDNAHIATLSAFLEQGFGLYFDPHD